MFTPTRAFFVTDSIIDDYVAYRRRASGNASPQGARPLYFQEWFDNLWQAQPLDQLVGSHD